MHIKTLTAISLTLFSFAAVAQKKSDIVNTHKYKWEAGIKLGRMQLESDVTGGLGLTTGVWISRSFTSWFSLNAGYNHGTAKGMNWLPAINYRMNTAWADKYAALVRTNTGRVEPGYIRNGQFVPANRADQVFYNYKTAINEFSIAPKFSLWFPSSRPLIGIHAFFGISVFNYKVKVDALKSNGETYAALFNEIDPALGKSAILSKLKAGMDGVYETNAESASKSTINTAFGGLGVSVRIKTRFTVGCEFYFTAAKSDLLDGQQWQEYAPGDPVLTREYDKLTNVALNIGYRF